MRLSGKKLLALGLAFAMTASVVSVQDTPATVQVEAATSRQGDEGCLEIPGTVSSFDEYNSSFLSVTGFAQEGVHDRTADLNTSRHRKVSTPAEFIDAVQAAKRGSYDASGNAVTPKSDDEVVTIIEVTKNIDLGTVVAGKNLEGGINKVQATQGLNKGYEITQTGSFAVTSLDLDDIEGLTIFSATGCAIEHCIMNIGSGGTNGVGSKDVVIRNLKFDGCWQWDNTGSRKEGGWAYMKIYKSSNIWIDHCTFTVAIDGNVDIESGSNGVTLSWCKFGMTPEEAKKEGSVVRTSIEFMEKRYQKAESKAKEKTNKSVSELIDIYNAQKKLVTDAGYNPDNDESMKKLKSENAQLHTSFTAAQKDYKKYYAESSNVLINGGTIYADMRLAGATPEEIMEYAAYHSKVHLVGSGDREFKDMDKESAITINEDGTYTLDPDGEYIEDGNARLQLTLAYDCYNNVGQRVPMIRMGTGHMFNCYVDNTGHSEALSNPAIAKYGNEIQARAINARDGAAIAADTCVFNNFNEPLIGQETQGEDVRNMNAPWSSLYATAQNFAVIVNSKVVNDSAIAAGYKDGYIGSSWDNNGYNAFTNKMDENDKNWSFGYTDKTLKKFCWKRTITHLGDVPIAEISRNVLALGDYGKDAANPTFTWHKNRADEKLLQVPSCLKKIVDEEGNPVYIEVTKNEKHVMYEPFQWEYDYDAKLEYEYQMLELGDVEEIIPKNSGAGSVTMLNSDNWVRTTYGKDEIILEGQEKPEPSEPADVTTSPEPSEPADIKVSPEPTVPAKPPMDATPSPEVSKAPEESKTPVESKIPAESKAPAESDNPAFMLGDVDDNKAIELNDALLTLKAALKISPLTEEQIKAADVNHDTEITLADAQKILKVALKIEKFE